MDSSLPYTCSLSMAMVSFYLVVDAMAVLAFYARMTAFSYLAQPLTLHGARPLVPTGENGSFGILGSPNLWIICQSR